MRGNVVLVVSWLVSTVVNLHAPRDRIQGDTERLKRAERELSGGCGEAGIRLNDVVLEKRDWA